MFMNIILPFTLVHKTCASVSDIIIGTTRFGLQSQTTRLHRSSNATRHQWPHTALETDHDQMDSKVINSANGLAVLWLPEQNKTAKFGRDIWVYRTKNGVSNCLPCILFQSHTVFWRLLRNSILICRCHRNHGVVILFHNNISETTTETWLSWIYQVPNVERLFTPYQLVFSLYVPIHCKYIYNVTHPLPRFLSCSWEGL